MRLSLSLAERHCLMLIIDVMLWHNFYRSFAVLCFGSEGTEKNVFSTYRFLWAHNGVIKQIREKKCLMLTKRTGRKSDGED